MNNLFGYAIITSNAIGRSEIVEYRIRPKPNRGIAIRRKTTVIVANGDYLVDRINHAIYCHPDDAEKLRAVMGNGCIV